MCLEPSITVAVRWPIPTGCSAADIIKIGIISGAANRLTTYQWGIWNTSHEVLQHTNSESQRTWTSEMKVTALEEDFALCVDTSNRINPLLYSVAWLHLIIVWNSRASLRVLTQMTADEMLAIAQQQTALTLTFVGR
jgi:hypothetical protein